MNRIDIIQALIDKLNYKSYCEIGVQTGESFIPIKCNRKIGIDPDPNSVATDKVTSDKFFSYNSEKFDIFFIDGLHHSDQFEKDVINALSFLNENGTIVCHDLSPETKYMQEIPQTTQGCWTGDVWKAWVKLRTIRSDLKMFVIDTDWGCGIIQIKKYNKIDLLKVNSEISYENFDKNRVEWMNIVSKEWFKEWLNDL